MGAELSIFLTLLATFKHLTFIFSRYEHCACEEIRTEELLNFLMQNVQCRPPCKYRKRQSINGCE
ncbi:hypothetical protein PR048_007341 [Dryococelus australis]|uniref:Secreted protein n=1 Tax=Dryococelus australis TaxID=614101 RepID=A0ABQ9IDH9_9NEOP|nr:hypothetical protein PR048_007341 [Dryococelus australis]